MASGKLVVLDRTGVLQPPAEHSLAWVADALARLSNAGFTLVVASNEPGISTGDLDLDELEGFHTRLSELVENRGGTVAGFFYCPHTDAEQCHCRKPKTGLIDAIELEFATPANDMVLLTDQRCDLLLAEATGATALVVLTEQGHNTQVNYQGADLTTCANLAAAAEYLLAHY